MQDAPAPLDSGFPNADSAFSGAPSPGALPDWKTFARGGEWRRAQAAATLGGAAPEVTAAITLVSALQEDVRARRYPAARRALGAYEGALADVARVSQGEAALLRSLAEPELLAPAIDALSAATGEADPAALQVKLVPAHAHALTRAEAHNALGVLHALRQEEDAAQGCFEQALTADPGHFRARMNIGNLALEGGRLAEAEAAYREVLRLAPDYDGAHHNLGVALRRQGRLYESVGSIRRAQRLGVRQSREQAREEMNEQLRVNPRLRWVRVAGIAFLVLVVALLFWTSRGGP